MTIGAFDVHPHHPGMSGAQRHDAASTMDGRKKRATVLVTGASGYTGGCLALRLREQGHAVRALVRRGSRTDHLVHAGVQLIEGDIRHPADVERAAAEVDCIYHIAAVFRTAGHPDGYYYDVNVGGTDHVLRAAKCHGVARVVHCSTIGVHGDVAEIPCHEETPFNPGDIYQVTKLEAEQLARAEFANGLSGSIVRPASIYGPGDLRHLKLFKTICKGQFRMFGSGETLYHPVYIDDLISGIILSSQSPAALGQTYIIAGEHYVTLNQLTAAVAAAVGCEPPRGRLPYWPLLAGAAVCEALCKPLRIDPPLHRRRASFFVNNRAFSIEKARRELGYQPRVDIDEGLRRTAAWYVAHGHLPCGRDFLPGRVLQNLLFWQGPFAAFLT
jgi:nucleoside-diphosphate-sugar epimerase